MVRGRHPLMKYPFEQGSATRTVVVVVFVVVSKKRVGGWRMEISHGAEVVQRMCLILID